MFQSFIRLQSKPIPSELNEQQCAGFLLPSQFTGFLVIKDFMVSEKILLKILKEDIVETTYDPEQDKQCRK